VLAEPGGALRPTMNAPAQDPYIGREVLGGQFKILQKIGSGGMGAVYKAAQPNMNRMVAIKILHPKLTERAKIWSRASAARPAR
jgi:serine/threonine protein kinase